MVLSRLHPFREDLSAACAALGTLVDYKCRASSCFRAAHLS